MDYKEKYKEALERARDVYTYYCDDREQLRKIESIFPELKENGDEVIRKAILEHIQLCTESIPDRDKFIAWLEKQGKQKTDPCTDCTNDKGCVTCEHGELRETPTRTLNADKVIAWMKTHGNLWPRVTIKINEVIDKFKKDFDL